MNIYGILHFSGKLLTYLWRILLFIHTQETAYIFMTVIFTHLYWNSLRADGRLYLRTTTSKILELLSETKQSFEGAAYPRKKPEI